VKLELLNLYEAIGEQEWRLPDLAFDAEGWAAVRLRVEANSIPEVGDTLAVLQASVRYDDLEGDERAISEVWLTLPVLDEKKFAEVIADRDVMRRVKEAEAAKIQERATQAAKNGDWGQVSELLAHAREMAAHSEYLAKIVANLEHLAAQRDQVLFSKEANYAMHSLSSRSRSKREFDAAFSDSDMPAYLQRRVKQGKSGHFRDDVREAIYRLEPLDDYPVAVIGRRRVLLDTGSSFSFGDGSNFEIAGKPFALGSHHGITATQLSRWMNTEMHSLLGIDVLSQFSVEVDWWNESVSFAGPGTHIGGVDLHATFLEGTPVLEFNMNGVVLKGVFDSGARICYIPRKVASEMVPVRRTKDFHVMIGSFETDIYELRLEIAGHSFTADCGVLPEQLASMTRAVTGFEWIIGTELLRQGRIGLDLSAKRVKAAWKNRDTA